VLQGEQLESILDGLKRNSLLDNIGHILTGYIGSVSFLRAVIQVVKTIRSVANNHRLVRFVCDPVLGDHGKFYVPRELVDVYKQEVLPLADVVTPNQFEVEQLTGVKVNSIEDAKLACQKLHDIGPKLVIITSIIFPEADEEGEHQTHSDVQGNLTRTRGNNQISVIASRRNYADADNDSCEDEIWCINSCYIKGNFTGTGDLCSALLLAWTEIDSNNIRLALEKVVGTMYSVIKRTSEGAVVDNTVAARELRLIQCKPYIENPPILFQAFQI
jgi:pyridoxine kinase